MTLTLAQFKVEPEPASEEEINLGQVNHWYDTGDFGLTNAGFWVGALLYDPTQRTAQAQAMQTFFTNTGDGDDPPFNRIGFTAPDTAQMTVILTGYIDL